MATELEQMIATVLRLFDGGQNTADIAWEMHLNEADVWRLLRLGREQRRAKEAQR